MADLVAAALQPGALITLVVLLGSVVLFISGWLAPDLTGLLAAGLLVSFHVIEPREALEGFGSPALITLAGPAVIFVLFYRRGAL